MNTVTKKDEVFGDSDEAVLTDNGDLNNLSSDSVTIEDLEES